MVECLYICEYLMCCKCKITVCYMIWIWHVIGVWWCMMMFSVKCVCYLFVFMILCFVWFVVWLMFTKWMVYLYYVLVIEVYVYVWLYVCVYMYCIIWKCAQDTVAEWLRRLTRNQLELFRTCTSPVSVVFYWIFDFLQTFWFLCSFY